jgi:hypothetical protein
MRQRLLAASPFTRGDNRDAALTADMKKGHSRSREWPVKTEG